MKHPADEGFVTNEEVPGYLQVSLRTVYRFITRKNIPAIRVGRRWRFRRRDIQPWLERARLPIIIFTGFSTDASAIETVNLGVAGYLVKPFPASAVLAAVAGAPGVSAA